MSEQTANIRVDIEVKCGGKDVEEEDLNGVVVDQDLSQPDMCVLTLKNSNHKQSNQVQLNDEVEVTVGGQERAVLFKGEVVGIEPIYQSGGESKCIVRAFNRLHRLLRGRKSRTFVDKTDQDIVAQIARDHQLQAEIGSSPKITRAHEYQHNETDLEFIRRLATRIGYDVSVEDQQLKFIAADTAQESQLELQLQDPGAAVALKTFTPRLSSSQIVQKVEVRGWDPEKKKEIVGTATVESSRLGSTTGDKSSAQFGGNVTMFEVDHPIFSVEEANAIAKARLGELTMDYIAGEAECVGVAKLKPGIVVKVIVNSEKDDDRFNGQYFVVGASHRYAPGKGQSGGYTTTARLRRDAEGGS